MNQLAFLPAESGEEFIRYRVRDEDRVVIRGVNHRKVSADQDVITFEIEDRPGLTPSFAQREFTRMVDRGDAEILRNYHAPTEASIRNTHEQLSLATCSPKKRRKAMFKAELCRRFLIKRKEADHRRRADGRKVNLGKPCLDWLLPEIANEIMMDRQKAARPGEEIVVTKLPSARQFARDMEKFMAGGMRVQKLISRQGTTSRQRRSANEAEYAIRFKFQKRCAADKRPSMAAAYLDYKGAIKQANDARAKGLPPLEHIGRKTFEKGIKKLDPFYVANLRYGEKQAREEFRITYQGVDAEYPGQRVEMDDFQVDLMVLLEVLEVWELLTPEEQALVKRERLWATGAIDVASKSFLALKFHRTAPRAKTAIETIELAMSDKSLIAETVGAGTPWPYRCFIEEVYTDNGSPFTAEETHVVLEDLGVSTFHAIAGVPELRPYIESGIGTLSKRFLSWFAGRTFSDFIEKGDYDPQANARLNVDVFNRVFLRALIDIYHHTPHAGLNGETPHNAWLRLGKKHGVEAAPSARKIREATGIDCFGVIGDKGLRCLGLHFQTQELMNLFRVVGKQKVRFRISRFDVSAISVWDGRRWFEVPNRYHLPRGISLWEWTTAGLQMIAANKANAELNMGAMLDAVNVCRASGESADRRAGVRGEAWDTAYLQRMDEQLSLSLRFAEDVDMRGSKLVDLTVVPFPGRHVSDQADRPAPPLQPERYRTTSEAAVSTTRQNPVAMPSQYGSADDVHFEE